MAVARRCSDGYWIELGPSDSAYPLAAIRPSWWRQLRRKIPSALRTAVFERDGNRCLYCGSVGELQIDHVFPFARGGTDEIDNLQVLCGPCNRAKSDKFEEEL